MVLLDVSEDDLVPIVDGARNVDLVVGEELVAPDVLHVDDEPALEEEVAQHGDNVLHFIFQNAINMLIDGISEPRITMVNFMVRIRVAL